MLDKHPGKAGKEAEHIVSSPLLHSLQIALMNAEATRSEMAALKRKLVAAEAQLSRLQAEYEAAAKGCRAKDQARTLKIV